MNKIGRIYQIMLSVLVPSSAVAGIWNSCHVSAGICAITAIALGMEQYREMLREQAGKKSLIKALEQRLDTFEYRQAALNSSLKEIDFAEIMARTDEIKSMMSTLKLSNLYARK